MTLKAQLIEDITAILATRHLPTQEVVVGYPQESRFGDYATNIALILAKKVGKSPLVLAEEIAAAVRDKELPYLANVSVAKPGFINLFIKDEHFLFAIKNLLADSFRPSKSPALTGKHILIEYAHPNTHKEMHIGHLRTLITGEALARLMASVGATVFRANYQGDIGPHVTKAMYGIGKLMEERQLTFEVLKTWSDTDKAHFLGEGYVKGSVDYEHAKAQIDLLNASLYASVTNPSLPREDPEIRKQWEMYQETRQWSLDYYAEFYQRFGTTFDQLFFESEMVTCGTEIVKNHVGNVFTTGEEGAIVFPGEQYGLHTRVFITKKGLPTYEAKDMCNAYKQYDAFPFDKRLHVVASEQLGYFQVVFKALELIDPPKFAGKQQHISMGMVQLTDRKMSSRTGDVLTVDWLLDQVKQKVTELMTAEKVGEGEKEHVIEQITIGAVKHSVLRVGVTQDVSFDIQKSVSLEGESGPYLQYTYARTQSVLHKAQITNYQLQNWESDKHMQLQPEERAVLRLVGQFDETVITAAEKVSPHLLASYLFALAQSFNLFYQKLPILKAEEETKVFRLLLTAVAGKVLAEGLSLLGIAAPQHM